MRKADGGRDVGRGQKSKNKKHTQGETGRQALVSELVKKLDAFFKP